MPSAGESVGQAALASRCNSQPERPIRHLVQPSERIASATLFAARPRPSPPRRIWRDPKTTAGGAAARTGWQKQKNGRGKQAALQIVAYVRQMSVALQIAVVALVPCVLIAFLWWRDWLARGKPANEIAGGIRRMLFGLPYLFFLIVAIICVIITPFLVGIFWEENGHAISDWASGVLLQIHAALSQLTHMDGAIIHGFLFGLGLIAAFLVIANIRTIARDVAMSVLWGGGGRRMGIDRYQFSRPSVAPHRHGDRLRRWLQLPCLSVHGRSHCRSGNAPCRPT